VRARSPGNLLRRQVDRHGDLHVVQRIGSLEHIAEDIRRHQERVFGRPALDAVARPGQPPEFLHRTPVPHKHPSCYRAALNASHEPDAGLAAHADAADRFWPP